MSKGNISGNNERYSSDLKPLDPTRMSNLRLEYL